MTAWRNEPTVWVPAQDGTMLAFDPDAPRFVSLVDYWERVADLSMDLDTARRNEADARRSAAEVSQREARWMMIEQRLRTTIHAQCGPAFTPECDCVKCRLGRELLAILNSDPPVGAGFRSEKGLSIDEVSVPTSGRPMGAERIVLTQASSAMSNEAEIQGGYYKAYPDA